MKIRGANLGEQDVDFRALSKWPYFKSDESKNLLLKKIEQLYLNAYKKSKESNIKPMQYKDGKVEIKPGMINHMCSSQIDSLSSISRKGILASEWFGKIESEYEGVFCSFVDRIHDESTTQGKMENRKTMEGKSDNSCVTLFFDEENPVMKSLLHLDYFEYENVKNTQPEMLDKKYNENEREIFDSIIEPYSEAGANFHTRGRIPECDWSAIPGGIPPFLVNGICVCKLECTNEYIEELSSLFPNATIFDHERNIIKMPLKSKEKEGVALENNESEIKITEDPKKSMQTISSEMRGQSIKEASSEIKQNYNELVNPTQTKDIEIQ